MVYIARSQAQYFQTVPEQREMARYLLKLGLLRDYNIQPGQSAIIRNAWGKPFFQANRDLFFNISHCQGGVALALSANRTGIDMERIRPFSMTAARKILTEDELATVADSEFPDRQFFRFWTLKESFCKALGPGLAYPLKKVQFEIGPGLSIHCSRQHCNFSLIEDDWGFITAICWSGGQPDPADKTIINLRLP